MGLKQYSMSFADSITHVPSHPERTAKRSMSGFNFDVVYQVWPNRASMRLICRADASDVLMTGVLVDPKLRF